MVEYNFGRESCKYKICSFCFCAIHFCFRRRSSLAIPCATFVSYPKNPCQQAGISVSTAWVPAFRRLLPAAQHEKLAECSWGYLGWQGAFQRNTSWAYSLFPLCAISLSCPKELCMYGGKKGFNSAVL